MVNVAENKQNDRSWISTDNLLKFTRASNHAVDIPKNANNSLEYTSDWSIRLICANGTNTEYIYNNLDTGTGKGFYLNSTSGTSYNFFISDGTNNNTVTVSGIPSTLAGFLKIVTITYTASSKTISLKVGDFGTTTQVVSLTSTIVNTQAITIGNNFAKTSGLDGFCAFVLLFNKALNAKEILYLDNEIGTVSKALHINCVGRWTLQEKYGDKAYDSVQQFNYAKGSPLSNNHGTLINYSVSELNNNRSDFYNKQLTPFLGLQGTANTSIDFTTGTTAKYSGLTDILYYFDLIPNGTPCFLFSQSFDNNNLDIRLGTSNIILNGNNTDDVSTKNFSLAKPDDSGNALMTLNKRNKFLIHYKAGQKIEAWLNGVKLSTNVFKGTDGTGGLSTGTFTYSMNRTEATIVGNITTGATGNTFTGILNEFATISSSTLTQTQKAALTTVDLPAYDLLTSQTRLQHSKPGVYGSTVYDLAPSPINGTKVNHTDANIREVNSGLPSFDNVLKLYYPPDGTPNKYGRCTLASPMTTLEQSSVGFGMHLQFYYSGVPKTSGTDLVDLLYIVNSGIGTMVGLTLNTEVSPNISLTLPAVTTGLSKSYSLVGHKGLCTFSFYIDRIAGTIFTAFNSVYDTGYNASIRTISSFEMSFPWFRMEIGSQVNRFNDTVQFIGASFYNKPLGVTEHLNTHLFSLLKPRKTPVAAYNVGNFSATGVTNDLVGTNNVQYFNYTANELNSAHADYAKTSITPLR